MSVVIPHTPSIAMHRLQQSLSKQRNLQQQGIDEQIKPVDRHAAPAVGEMQAYVPVYGDGDRV